jgi:branched-chain amino acid transport system permease protein
MPRNKLLQYIGLGAAVAVMVALPFSLGERGIGVMTLLLINIILAVSFRVIVTTGGWSLAHIPLMGLGGYVSAILTTIYGWPVWGAVPIAGLSVAGAAVIIGFPLVRTKGFAFFIGSYAIGEALRLSWFRFRFPFGAHNGIINIPPPESIPLPVLRTVNFDKPLFYYLLVLGATILCLVIMYRIEHSRTGDTFKAIYSDENLAKSVGISIPRYRLLAFVIGCFFAGIAGALYAHYYHSIHPDAFSFIQQLYLLAWVVVGGYNTFYGPIIGVVVLTAVKEGLVPLAEWVPLIFGSILMVTLLFLPRGLESLRERVSPLTAKLSRIG